MSIRTQAVGDSLEAQCTKCRKATPHVVVETSEDGPSTVRCVVCHGVHAYRAVKKAGGGSKRAKRPRAPVSRRPLIVSPEEWGRMVRELDLAKAIRYNMAETFRVNDVVQHPTFGVGLVRKTIRPNKMEVLFENGTKLLRCAL